MLKMETEVSKPKFINVKEAEAARQNNNTAKVNKVNMNPEGGRRSLTSTTPIPKNKKII